MWLRSALTSLLAAILLCVSCAASTCAVECAMSTLRPAGHTSTDHGPAAKGEAIHHHCGQVAVSPELASAVDPGGAHIGLQCGGACCTQHQMEASIVAGYRLNQPTADSVATVMVQRVPVAVLLWNYRVSDLMTLPPKNVSLSELL
jgi:hypothetical protein